MPWPFHSLAVSFPTTIAFEPRRVPDAWGRLSFFFPCPGVCQRSIRGACGPAPCARRFWGSLPPPVDATGHDPGTPCAGGGAVGQLCEVHSRPDLPEPIV